MRSRGAMHNASGDIDMLLYEGNAKHEAFEKVPSIDQCLLAIDKRRLDAGIVESESFRLPAAYA